MHRFVSSVRTSYHSISCHVMLHHKEERGALGTGWPTSAIRRTGMDTRTLTGEHGNNYEVKGASYLMRVFDPDTIRCKNRANFRAKKANGRSVCWRVNLFLNFPAGLFTLTKEHSLHSEFFFANVLRTGSSVAVRSNTIPQQ